jgi:hypothetical protein
MKPIVVTTFTMIFALLFTTTAEAKKRKKNGGGGKVDKEKVERAKKREEEKIAVDRVLKEKDTDGNDQLTLEEWLAGESDEGAAVKKFMDANKNRDKSLTRSEIGTMLGF